MKKEKLRKRSKIENHYGNLFDNNAHSQGYINGDWLRYETYNQNLYREHPFAFGTNLKVTAQEIFIDLPTIQEFLDVPYEFPLWDITQIKFECEFTSNTWDLDLFGLDAALTNGIQLKTKMEGRTRAFGKLGLKAIKDSFLLIGRPQAEVLTDTAAANKANVWTWDLETTQFVTGGLQFDHRKKEGFIWNVRDDLSGSANTEINGLIFGHYYIKVNPVEEFA